jgi:hypothetical protein
VENSFIVETQGNFPQWSSSLRSRDGRVDKNVHQICLLARLPTVDSNRSELQYARADESNFAAAFLDLISQSGTETTSN